MEAEPREVGGEARLRCGDAEVRHQGEAQAAADRRALDRADAGLLRAEQAGRLLVKVFAALGRAGLRTVGEIGAGAERLALRAQHVGADVVVLVERLEGIGDLVDQGIVEEIVRRPLDLDHADMTFVRDADILVGAAHFGFPLRA